MQFCYTNHLGSSSVITDQNGLRKEQMEYFPFGAYRAVGVPTGTYDFDANFPDVFYTFTGQEDDDDLGLYNFKARLYDPVLGRFISADTIVPNPEDPQSLNRYSYCLNNPLRYIDPTGNEEAEPNADPPSPGDPGEADGKGGDISNSKGSNINPIGDSEETEGGIAVVAKNITKAEKGEDSDKTVDKTENLIQKPNEAGFPILSLIFKVISHTFSPKGTYSRIGAATGTIVFGIGGWYLTRDAKITIGAGFLGAYLGGKVGDHFDSKMVDQKSEQQMEIDRTNLNDYYGRHK